MTSTSSNSTASRSSEGILWPRWSPDWTFGYGYPFFTIYAPLSTFVGVLFNQILGLGYEASVKAVLALSVLGSGLAMYGFVRSWLGRRAGLVAAVAYMAVPVSPGQSLRAGRPGRVRCARIAPAGAVGLSGGSGAAAAGSVIAAGVAFAAIMWTSNLVALVFAPGLAAYVAGPDASRGARPLVCGWPAAKFLARPGRCSGR